MTLNIDSAVLVNYYKLSETEFRGYFSTALIFFVFFFILLLSGMYASSSLIVEYFNLPSFVFVLSSLVVGLIFFVQIRQNLWRVSHKITTYGTFTISLSLIKNLAGLVLIYFFSFGWEGLVYGHLLAYLLTACYAIYTFAKEKLIKLNIQHDQIYDIIKVGFPMSLHKLGLWLGNFANRIIIMSILGAQATGSYGIGATFGVIVTLVEDAMTKAFVPNLFEKLRDINFKKKTEIVSLTYKFYLLLLAISIIIMTVGYFGVGIIFGSSYNDTKIFIIPLVAAAMFKGFYKLHVNYIFFTKKTLKITQITFIMGLVNIGLAYYMISLFGLSGGAYSQLVINFVQYILVFYVANKLIPMPWLGNKIPNVKSD